MAAPAPTVDKLPAKKPAPAPVTTPAPAPAHAPAGSSAGLAAHAARATRGPKPTEPIQLQGSPTFAPSAPWVDYIKASSEPAIVDVAWGNLVARAPLAVRWDRDLRFVTPKSHEPISITHPFFVGLPAKLAPMLFVHIRGETLDGFAGPAGAGSGAALTNAIAANTEALGLLGFQFKDPAFRNEIKSGHFYFSAGKLPFHLGGWVEGHLDLGIEDDHIMFSADLNATVRGLGAVGATITRSSAGVYSGQAEIAAKVGKLSGSVLATYTGGDLAVTGTVKYASEKFNGSLTAVVATVAEAAEAARGRLDPGKLLPTEKAATGDDKGGGPKATKGERGLAAWGNFDFAFTDWLTGTAMGVLDPYGHITIVGKIAPPKSVELMKEHVWNTVVPPFPLEITARYGVPYVADVHIGVGFELGAVARIGPAVLTDMEIGGTYSTDPAVLQDFSISGAFRISAYAGLNLSVYGKAGLTILKHDIDFIAKLTGTAGIKAYAEARPTIGYREKADPIAGKKGEAYLQGHLEAAAQPFLGLAGDLEVKLTSPWWSPAPNKTWTWPLFDLTYPLGGQLGVAADIDYVIGSGKLPDIKLGKVDFDSSKFMDSMLDKQIPAGKGGETEKAGSWQPVAPKTPIEAPPSVAPKAAPGDGKPRAGTPPAKAAKGGQTHDEAANVPKTADASKRWLEGMQALAAIHDKAEKNPENETEIHDDLARIKRQFGFDRLEALAADGEWDIYASLNPHPSKPVSKARRASGSTAKWPPNGPPAPKPPKPEKGTAGADTWRYKRYLYESYDAGKKRSDVLPFKEYKTQYYDVVVAGGRPGRPGGRDQIETRKKMAAEENYINTEKKRLGETFVDLYKANSKGGEDFVEVDDMLQSGIPDAAMRRKLKGQLPLLGKKDRLVFVDKLNSEHRITYRAGEDPAIVETRKYVGWKKEP